MGRASSSTSRARWTSSGSRSREGLPAGFPDDWVGTDRTAGNCVVAHAGDDGAPVRGQARDGGLTFDPDDRAGDEQRVVNLFCLACIMHDWFYLLGFREADGNFQRDDLGRGGLAEDPVDARAYDGPVWATASMRTRPDGISPVMRMGLVTRTRRHTALDPSVVFHEFTHGVTDRLVGGPLDSASLDEAQSAGLGEGWSDFVACAALGTRVIAAWVTGLRGGIRGFPYDGHHPASFGDLGTGRYAEVHAIGEVWCATLVALADQIGSTGLVAQLMVDGLKLTPANPSFLDARDAILLALDHRLRGGLLDPAGHATARRAAWAAFARFGMGPDAACNGPSLFGIRPDFGAPDLPEAPVEAGLARADDFKRIRGIGPGIEQRLHGAG